MALILDLNDEVEKKPEPEPSPQGGQIVKRVIHTRVEVNIYPNGQSFISKSQSWFEDKIYQVKKKVKKKAAPSKKVVTKEVEEY